MGQRYVSLLVKPCEYSESSFSGIHLIILKKKYIYIYKRIYKIFFRK